MLNQINLMGRLTRPPELETTVNGIPFVGFTVAVNRDTNREKTDFIRCVAWRKTAEFISRCFSKGQMIIISGQLQLREWKDSNGNNRQTAEVVVNSAYFGDSRQNQTHIESTETSEDYEPIEDSEALPF